VFLLVRVNNRLIIMLLFRLFKNSLSDTIVEIDKCYNTNICSFLEKLYSIFKVRVLINKLKSFKSNIESYIVYLFNLLKIYWSNVRTLSSKKEYSYKKGRVTNEPLILMLPTTLQGSSSTTPQRESGQQGSNTTAPSSSVETESSYFNLVKDHHLFNSNIEFINREKSILNGMIANIENKLEPFEQKRLIHLQNGGSNNNTSQFFTAEDSARYSQYNNEINNLKTSVESLTNIFNDHQRIKNLADNLDSTKNEIATVLKPKLLETRENCTSLINYRKELRRKLKAHDKDPINHPFSEHEFVNLIFSKGLITDYKKLRHDLIIKIKGKETVLSSAARELKKEKLYPVTRNYQTVSEAIAELNPV
jgi:hypothetical protein